MNVEADDSTVLTWLRPIGVFLACQVIFWTFLFVIESKTQPQNFLLPSELPLYLADDDGEFDLTTDPIMVPYNNEPAYIYRDGSRAPKGMFVIEFQRPTVGAPAFFVGWDVAIDELYLNGQHVPIRAKQYNTTQMSGYAPGLYDLPVEMLKPGLNTIGVVRHGKSNKFISHFAVGDFGELRENFRWAQIVAYVLPYASLGASVFILALCLLVPWSRDDAMQISVFGIVLLASVFRNLQYFGVEIISTFPWVHVVHFMAVYLLLLGFAGLAVAWTGGSWKSLKRIAYIYIAAIGLVVAAIPFFANGGSVFGLTNIFYWGWKIETGITVGMAIFVFGRILWASKSAQPMRLIEHIIILFCVMVILTEHIDHVFRLNMPFQPELPIKNYITSIVSVVLPLGLCITVANESARARRVLMNVNQTLETALADKEAEIRGQARDKAVVDERRRIMRDMHDGLGAILSGIVLQTRSRQLPYEDVPQAVQNGLDELRLIIDSLDSAGDTLAVALGAFRERADGYLAAAGIELSWDIDPRVAAYEFAANDVLQIYRILQEATTNIARHSQADKASFSIKISDQGSTSILQIDILDNGIGLTGSSADGKGLKSMRERARKIGADIRFRNSEPGTHISLAFTSPHDT